MEKPFSRAVLSNLTILTTGLLSRLFLYATQHPTVEGLDEFLVLLDARRRPHRGLITGNLSIHLASLLFAPSQQNVVSNHKSVFVSSTHPNPVLTPGSDDVQHLASTTR